MPKAVNLDAMIQRADFCETDNDETQSEKIPALGLNQLDTGFFLVPNLRKPDFQRETNQWTVDQVVVFLKSFLDNELVPSIILWKAPGKIFVIDGAHRLSALIAWINDDYGDRNISKKFYNNQISGEQLKIADTLRNRISREIGSFTTVKSAMMDLSSVESDVQLAGRASNAITRTLSLQWVEGDAEKAESSFFKINKQGTPLDKTEERLLRNRRKPIAIGARSIVRAGFGHKYWSKFETSNMEEVEELSREIHNIMFSPEIEFPIKTLNLPHGGSASPLDAYNILMDIFGYTVEGTNKANENCYIYLDDESGEKTINALKEVRRVLERITGNVSRSLGLHPAVYFYSASGRHWDMIFVSMVNVLSKAIRNNDDNFFRQFTKNRTKMEEMFLENKRLIVQANIAIRSASRVQKWSDLIEKIARGGLFIDGVTQDGILDALELSGKIVASEITESGANFSSNTRSAIFLKESINSSQKCPLCGGYILVEKSVSYDHIIPKSKGGKGDLENVQLTHPYCNSLKGNVIKN